MTPRGITFWLLVIMVCTIGDLAGAVEKNTTASKVWTLREAIRVALTNSPNSKIAMERITAAEATVTAEKSAFYPRLSFRSHYSQTDNPMYSFGNILNQGEFHQGINFNDPGRTDNLQMAARLSYLLYNGGRDLAGLTASEAQKHATEMQFAAIQAQLAFEVIRSFNIMVQSERLIRAYQDTVDAVSQAVAVAKARYDAGDLLLSDLLDLEVQQSKSREDLIHAQHTLEISRRIFINLLGGLNDDFAIDPESSRCQIVPIETAGGQRPELQAMDGLLRAAEARLRQVRGGLYPSVESYAGYEVDTGFELGGSGDSWQAGVILQYDLFDGHRTSSEIKKAMAFLAEAREQKRKTELDIKLEEEQALFALNEALQRLDVTEKIVQQAEESAAINRARFKEGLILSSDLIAVENRLTSALIRRTQAETARCIAIADLRRALGLPQFSETPAEMQ